MVNMSIDEARNLKDGLIRKMVSGGAVLLAPITSDPVDTFTEEGGLKKLEDYSGLGRLAKDGAPVFKVDEGSEDIETWGEIEPSRRDYTSRTLTVEWTCQDTRREVLEVVTRQSLSDLDIAANGEFSITDPSKPGTVYYRAMLIGADGDGDDAVYFGRFLPKVNITVGEEDWNPGAAAVYPMTATAFVDGDLGYSSKRFYGGPGILKRIEAMGFNAPSGELGS